MTFESMISTPIGRPVSEKDAEKLRFIEELTRNADKVQEGVLEEILKRNGETEYLKRFGLDGKTDKLTFKEKVPVVTYKDLQPDIQRIANGDRSQILCSHPISELLTSSGTSSGERKLMPITQEELERRIFIYSLLIPIMNLYVPDLDKGKGLYFLLVRSETKTPGGLFARAASTSVYKSEHFISRPYDPFSVYTSPNAVILCPDPYQGMYVHMICGLYQRLEVIRAGAVFASAFCHAIRFLQLNWSDLVHDIRTGTLNPKITDQSVRESVSDLVKPDPALADFIREECKDSNWAGIITRIWPNTKYLDVIVTGAMAQYIPILEFYSGGLPMVSSTYTTSECHISINLKPMCEPSEISYTVMPNMAYFEFIPHTPNNSSITGTDLVDLTDVEVGKEYEIVITTYSGLYRYCVGDILLATGYHNGAPGFRFMRRKDVVLSVDEDKTDESELQKAVERSSELLGAYGASVAEYTSRADTKEVPGHYVVYWELLIRKGGRMPEGEVVERCCLEMEEALNAVYRQSRVENGSIGPLEIRVVRSGTFEELMDYAISRGASINQYKVPRCVTFQPIVELLDSRVLSASFSPGCPTWVSPHMND